MPGPERRVKAAPAEVVARGVLLAGWVVLLALLPWWLDLLVMLGLVACVIHLAHRSASQSDACRSALRWGLAGFLFAVQRALGGDLLAWGAALLGALVGFSLVALFESFLFRRGQPVRNAASPEWKDMAMAPVGPPAHIIELEPVRWFEAGDTLVEASGASFRFETRRSNSGTYRFDSGRQLDGLSPRYALGQRWFVADMAQGEGNVLLNLSTGRAHHLRHWHLCGWEGDTPWLSRDPDGLPVSLHEVLGQGED